ncbi:MAG: DUF3592 domain-containing protein [Proteobacteria bacterium]|nr:DUF3592 domain-containing protein [Pseudomonadota bacterium]
MKAERAYIATWPHTAGHLLYVHRNYDSKGKGLGRYYLVAEYSYAVDGITYHGQRIGLTWDLFTSKYENRVIDYFRDSYPPLVVESETRKGVKDVTFKIADQEVAVFYDPKAPQSSYLDIEHDNAPPPLWNKWAGPFFVIAGGFSILALGISLLRGQLGLRRVPSPKSAATPVSSQAVSQPADAVGPEAARTAGSWNQTSTILNQSERIPKDRTSREAEAVSQRDVGT